MFLKLSMLPPHGFSSQVACDEGGGEGGGGGGGEGTNSSCLVAKQAAESPQVLAIQCISFHKFHPLLKEIAMLGGGEVFLIQELTIWIISDSTACYIYFHSTMPWTTAHLV